MQAKDIEPCITKRFPENYEAEIDRITIIDRFHSPGPRTIKHLRLPTLLKIQSTFSES